MHVVMLHLNSDSELIAPHKLVTLKKIQVLGTSVGAFYISRVYSYD